MLTEVIYGKDKKNIPKSVSILCGYFLFHRGFLQNLMMMNCSCEVFDQRNCVKPYFHQKQLPEILTITNLQHFAIKIRSFGSSSDFFE